MWYTMRKRQSKVLCQRAVPYELYKGLTFTTIWLEVNPRKKMLERLCLCRAFLNLSKQWRIVVRNVLDCINAFIPLLSTEYELVLGRKGVSVTLRISFDKKDCFHLMGLQYLVDRPEFFPEEKMDYSKNQASWTLLYKKKIDLSTGIEKVLYNRIK